MALPDAGTKLRLVLDYLPCEACLAQPVADQDLLCTICARVDREVAVKVGTRTTVLIERPTAPEAPIVIPPAPPMPEAPPAPREVVVRWADEPSPGRPGSIEIVVEPLLAAPAPVPAPVPVPLVATEPEAPEPDFSVDDIAEYIPPSTDYFDFQRGPPGAYARPRPSPERAPEPEPTPAPVAPPPPPPPVEELPQDDFVFRPPAEPEPTPPPPPVEEEIFPVEEVAVESAESDERWAPPADLLPDEPVQSEAPPEPVEEIFEAEIVEDEEEVLEMEVVEDEPEPTPPPSPPATAAPAPAAPSTARSDTDLYRLRGFDASSETGLAGVGVTQIAHLSGHDAGELAQRSGVPFDRLVGWIQVADLVQEVGVPIEAAVALVAAGVAGPRGLRDADPEEVADRVAAFGGYTVNSRDVARWKRRA